MSRPGATTCNILVLLTALLLSPAWAADGAKDHRLITIVSVSDWHGQLEPLSIKVEGKDQLVGGAAILKYYFDRERQRNPEGTLVVTAGDAFGATPPISSFFEDVPAVEAQNAMGFDVDTLGNHNFDYGLDGLRKLMALARFPYVAANIVDAEGRTLAPPYHHFIKQGVKVGVIGIGHPETPALVFPGRTGGYQFLEPIAVINRYAAEMRELGTQIVIVIAHLGAAAVTAEGSPTGPLADVAKAIRGVDVLIGDHSDVSVNAVINNITVIENRSKGAQYTVIDLVYDMATQTIVSRSSVQRLPLVAGATPDLNIQGLIDQYKARLQPLFDKKVGETAVLLSRSRQEESLLGNLTTDILRMVYGTQLAFDVSGALRADLPSSYQPADKTLRRPAPGYATGPPYDLVQGDFFAVFPFNNVAVTFKLTGKTLWNALEHSVSQGTLEAGTFANTAGGFLQISGFTYRFDPRKPAGQRIISVALDDGTPIANDQSQYTAVTGDFAFHGGDGYIMLNNGTGTSRELIADTIGQAVRQGGTVTMKREGRITQVQPR